MFVKAKFAFLSFLSTPLIFLINFSLILLNFFFCLLILILYVIYFLFFVIFVIGHDLLINVFFILFYFCFDQSINYINKPYVVF